MHTNNLVNFNIYHAKNSNKTSSTNPMPNTVFFNSVAWRLKSASTVISENQEENSNVSEVLLKIIQTFPSSHCRLPQVKRKSKFLLLQTLLKVLLLFFNDVIKISTAQKSLNLNNRG